MNMKKKELIYYLTCRAVNREIERKEDLSDTVPVNDYDKDPVPDLFIPQITLVSNDNGVRIADIRYSKLDGLIVFSYLICNDLSDSYEYD